MALAANVCILALSGSWSYRATYWTVLVVSAFLWRAHRLGICCPTVFVTQNWVLTLSNVSWRHFFAKYWQQNVFSASEIFLSMRYINLHFTLVYCCCCCCCRMMVVVVVWRCTCVVKLKFRFVALRNCSAPSLISHLHSRSGCLCLSMFQKACATFIVWISR